MTDIYESTIQFLRTETLSMAVVCFIVSLANLLFSYFKATKLSEVVNVVIKQDDKETKFEALKEELDKNETIEKINAHINEIKNITGSTENIEIYFEQKKKNST